MHRKTKRYAILIPVVILLFTASFSFAYEYREIQYEQLNIKEEDIGILPTDLFYFFKEWSRGFTMLFASDPLVKAELELNILHEKASEVLKVSEVSRNSSYIIKSLNNYQKSSGKLISRMQSLPQDQYSQDFANYIDEKLIMHELLFLQLSNRFKNAPDYQKINEAIEDTQFKALDVIVENGNRTNNIKNKAEEEISKLDKHIFDLERSALKLEVLVKDPITTRGSNSCNKEVLPTCESITSKTSGFLCVDNKWKCAYFDSSIVLNINNRSFLILDDGSVQKQDNEASSHNAIVEDDRALNLLFQFSETINKTLNDIKAGLNQAKSFFNEGDFAKAYAFSVVTDMNTNDISIRVNSFNP